MKRMGLLTILVAIFVMAAGEAVAQYDPCDIPPGIYRTQTQGGWGADCHGHNPGCLRDTYFASAFPSGITIGGTYTIHFTSSDAVRVYLPAGTTPGVLTSNYVDPTSATEAGVFASQVLALKISVGFADADVPGFGDLRHLVILHGVSSPSGAFAGWTADQLLALANQVLGGNTAALPPGISVSNLNDVVTSINENFDDGTVSNDYLVEPDCNQLPHCHLAVNAIGQTLTCVDGVVTPNPFDIAVTVTNDSSLPADGIVVNLSDGSGTGGTATVSPASITVGSLASGASQTVHFTATGTFNVAGGDISFTGVVNSTDCGSYDYSVLAQVPPCTPTPPCNPDPEVVLVPNNPQFPGEQSVHACAHLTDGYMTQVIVPVSGPTNIPTVSITAGCYDDCGDPDAIPLSDWILGDWTFSEDPPTFTASLTAAPGATGCCVCMTLDFVLPAELSAEPRLIPGDRQLTLSFSVADEHDVTYYQILRDGLKVTELQVANGAYTCVDENLMNGRRYEYSIWVVELGQRKQLSYEGRTIWDGTPSAEAQMVTEYALHPCHPNPFNPETQISYDIKETGVVTLKVYNMLGREVASLVNEKKAAGQYTVQFSGRDLPSGVYICRLDANNFTALQKMVLLK